MTRGFDFFLLQLQVDHGCTAANRCRFLPIIHDPYPVTPRQERIAQPVVDVVVDDDDVVAVAVAVAAVVRSLKLKLKLTNQKTKPKKKL